MKLYLVGFSTVRVNIYQISDLKLNSKHSTSLYLTTHVSITCKKTPNDIIIIYVNNEHGYLGSLLTAVQLVWDFDCTWLQTDGLIQVSDSHRHWIFFFFFFVRTFYCCCWDVKTFSTNIRKLLLKYMTNPTFKVMLSLLVHSSYFTVSKVRVTICFRINTW